MKKFLYTAILTIFCLSALNASAESAIEQVNNIKRAPDDYFFGQSTTADKAQAKLAAENILIVKISEWLEGNAPDKPFSPALASKFNYIDVPRGKSTMVLAYIERTVVSEYAFGSAGKQPAPADTAVGPEPSAISEPSEPTAATASNVAADQSALSENARELVDELLAADDLSAAFGILEKYQTRRKIKNFGDISSRRDIGDCFVIIGTGDFKIDTILSAGPERYNLKTGNSDQMSNYRGRPVVWFIF